MFWALVTLQLCALAAGAQRYGDWIGARVPQYDMDDADRNTAPIADEYGDRSPDASPHFDYKYEEEIKDKMEKSPMKNENEDVWHASNKKTQLHDDYPVGKHEDDFVPEVRTVRRNKKHRTRIKTKALNADNERGAPKYVRSRKIDNDDVDIRKDYYVNNIKGGSRDENTLDSEHFDYRDTTEKFIRRKPRDRTVSRRRLDNEDMERDEDEVKTLRREDEADSIEDQPDERPRFYAERPAPPPPIPDISKLKPKNYPEYDDFYDMKRVNSIKSKLPELLRKTQASSTEEPSTRHLQDITYRRANVLAETMKSTTEATTKTTTTVESTTSAKKTTVTSTERTDVIPLSTEADMSLAEKSRLSILRKAQRKDSVRNVTWTTKPPVLMQVTKGMNTLVMVEPPGQNFPFHAKQIYEDSPERVAKAKKLMRHKLVAGARNIQDLTDNWDQMVCDYIDVSLLDGSTTTTTAASVAERELKALLGHRQRKDVHTTPQPSSGSMPITFPPNAVDPDMDDEWIRFLGTNSKRKLQQSIYLTALTIINCLKYYT